MHNYNGKFDRRIRQIKESFEKNFQNESLSVLQWETLSSVIANTINGLPIGLGNIISDYENMDLATPTRLRSGRNDDRSPAATMEVTGNPDRILKENRKPDWYFMYQDGEIILNGFLQIMTKSIVMLYYSWKKMGCLVTATSMAWLMKLYPAKMAVFVKWLFDIEIIKKMWIDTQQDQYVIWCQFIQLIN